MSGLDSLIIITQFFLVIAVLSVFIMIFIVIVKNSEQSINKNLRHPWLYIPMFFVFVIFVLSNVLQKQLNNQIIQEISEKLDKSERIIIPNTNIILDKSKIEKVKTFERFTSDSIYELKLHDYYYIRLERTLEDSNKYWIFVEKYMSTSGGSPAAVFNYK